jgi:hypothetical protein
MKIEPTQKSAAFENVRGLVLSSRGPQGKFEGGLARTRNAKGRQVAGREDGAHGSTGASVVACLRKTGAAGRTAGGRGDACVR